MTMGAAGTQHPGRPALLQDTAGKETFHDRTWINRVAYAAANLALGATTWSVQAADDPLPLWNDGPAR
jgi:hypothetical protein